MIEFYSNFVLVINTADESTINKVSDNLKGTQIIRCDDEAQVIENLLYILEKYNPDIVLCTDSEFQFGILIKRISELRIGNPSRMGKLKQYSLPNFKVCKKIKIT